MEHQKNKEKQRWKSLLSFYKPYMGLFWADMFFAMLGAAVMLVIPLVVRHITSNVVAMPVEEAVAKITQFGILLIVLVTVELGCNFFITYYGHMMGTYIERDLRNAIFGHYQSWTSPFPRNLRFI